MRDMVYKIKMFKKATYILPHVLMQRAWVMLSTWNIENGKLCGFIVSMQRPRYCEEKDWNVIFKPWPRLPGKGLEVDSPVTEVRLITEGCDENRTYLFQQLDKYNPTCDPRKPNLIAMTHSGAWKNFNEIAMQDIMHQFESISRIKMSKILGYIADCNHCEMSPEHPSHPPSFCSYTEY
ncbi:Protein of unknown function [Pyronema omphalodes CBS 100304]|uniref:Uncharacterized protein n=1 Tax=Pyronema omphalodes (strain CBS 100304) TaxID=1076935 RepID=U4L7S3_PYROM|nr:Protein of unknown function [Pyronema omphalodes CBS 100304]